MRLIQALILSVSFLSTTAAFADSKFTCTDSKYGIVNFLTVQGSGNTAKIHIENPTLVGDLTYNDAYTQAAEQAGYDVFTGLVTDLLDTPPTQIMAALLFEPSLLNDTNGKMEQFGGDDLIVLDCIKTP